MHAVLVSKRRVGRVLRVTVPSGEFTVEYSGYGIGYESVLVDGERVARESSPVRMVPRFEFAVGPHQGVIRISTKLWRDLLGPIVGRLESFTFELDGKILYHDERKPAAINDVDILRTG